MSLMSKRIYEFGEYRLTTGARLLELKGQAVPLGSKAFEVLTCLVVRAGTLVTKDELLQTVWPESFVEEGNLSQQIFAVRRALGTQAGFILTVPGRGYQFTETVREVAAPVVAPTMQPGGFVIQRLRERTHIVIEETVAPTERSNLEPANAALALEVELSRKTYADGTELVVADAGEAGPLVSGDATTVAWNGEQPALPAPSQKRRLWPWAAAAVVVLVCVLAVRYETRLPANQRVVIAELENHTQDSGLDIVLRNALEIDLDQSPYIDVMSGPETLGVLKLMDRRPDTALVPGVAREVCLRSNRQVLISGSVADVGRNYLLTLEAMDCNSGKILAGTKEEMTSKDQMLAALDRASASLRRALGEPSKTLERFQVPVAQATTSSLEALQQYSTGEYLLGRMGKEEAEVLPFFERAVELDPHFAMAQTALATGYYSLGESELAEPYYQRAFDLSGQVSEKERLYIRAHYYSDDKLDQAQGLREYKTWAETYPQDWGPWIDMADAHSQLGQYAEAIEAAQNALKLDPSRGIIYGVLARTYMHMGRYADAKSIAQKAFTLGKDTNLLHATLLEIALAQNDAAVVANEIAWSHGKEGEWDFLDLQALAAAQQGRMNDATVLFQQAYTSAGSEMLPEKANDILMDEASAYLDGGMETEARDTLRSLTGKQTVAPDARYIRAELGDVAAMKRSLVAYSSSAAANAMGAPEDSPRVRARLALNEGNPLEAIAELRGLADQGNFSTAMDRADAYLMAHQTADAEKEYRRILENSGVDPVSSLLPLAQLGLARAEAQAGSVQQSKEDYETLFGDWRQADTNLPILLVARKEYAALHAGH